MLGYAPLTNCDAVHEWSADLVEARCSKDGSAACNFAFDFRPSARSLFMTLVDKSDFRFAYAADRFLFSRCYRVRYPQ